MNWDAIGAVAEALGAAGVIATLVYLTTQIRQNTTMLRSQSRRQLLEGVTADTERVLLNKDIYDLFMKDRHGGTLSEDEEAKMTTVTLSYLGNLEIQFHELADGSLDPTFQDTLQYRLSTILGGAGRERWEQSRNFFSREFQSYVDDQLQSGVVDKYPSSLWSMPRDDA